MTIKDNRHLEDGTQQPWYFYFLRPSFILPESCMTFISGIFLSIGINIVTSHLTSEFYLSRIASNIRLPIVLMFVSSLCFMLWAVISKNFQDEYKETKKSGIQGYQAWFDLVCCKRKNDIPINAVLLISLTFISFGTGIASIWLFLMANAEDSGKEYRELKPILDSVLASVKLGGMILVLQPIKGGTFKKLFSKYIPGSDKNYSLTHKFLQEYGFTGPNNVVSTKDELLVIWSGFDYNNEDQLFRGIASVLMLECGCNLKYETFIQKINEYKVENGLPLNQKIQLTVCVNIYYLSRNIKV